MKNTIALDWDNAEQVRATLVEIQEAASADVFHLDVSLLAQLITEAEGWGASEAEIRTAYRAGRDMAYMGRQ